MENFTNLSDRLRLFIEYKGISINKFSASVDASNSYFNKILKDNNSVGSDRIEKILRTYPEINAEWLLTGNGSMLKSEQNQELSEKQKKFKALKKQLESGEVIKKRNLIPLYNDVATIGGTQLGADMSAVSSPTEYIDAGDWFPNATAAIRHYNDSMTEYPSGCILALRQIYDVKSIVWGQNYVIETSEIRVTKRIQTCKEDKNYIMGYSTNNETYPDGSLVHEPIHIEKADIKRLFLVVGHVVKEHSSAPVFISK